jgi:predicted DsbA family dithiol-disulfide isomerase
MALRVDVVSDFVCPWCFLGRRRLGAALAILRAERPGLALQVNWLPYFLTPGTPVAGRPYRPFLETKFGGPAAVDRLFADIREAAGDELSFEFERIAVRPNTLRAHRLCYRAQSSGYRPDRVDALVEAIFVAYFQQGRDIGDIETLADIAVECGDRREAVVEYLSGPQDEQSVRKMAAQVHEQGVSGVPFFIFDRRIAVSGAQSATALGAALRQVLPP